MKINVYTVYDTKAAAYLQPFFMNSTEEAIRAVTHTLHDSQHNFAVFSEDFHLFHIGSFNNQDGKLNWHQPKSVISLHELKASITKTQE